MNQQLNDDETLSQDTDCLFFKDQVWPSSHQLRINAEYIGAFWGFVATQSSMNIYGNRRGVTQERKKCPNKGIHNTKKYSNTNYTTFTLKTE